MAHFEDPCFTLTPTLQIKDVEDGVMVPVVDHRGDVKRITERIAKPALKASAGGTGILVFGFDLNSKEHPNTAELYFPHNGLHCDVIWTWQGEFYNNRMILNGTTLFYDHAKKLADTEVQHTKIGATAKFPEDALDRKHVKSTLDFVVCGGPNLVAKQAAKLRVSEYGLATREYGVVKCSNEELKAKPFHVVSSITVDGAKLLFEKNVNPSGLFVLTSPGEFRVRHFNGYIYRVIHGTSYAFPNLTDIIIGSETWICD